MVRNIVRDTLFLSQKSTDAVKEDREIITDLKDTLKAHKNECVGMAANMIGFPKNIIIVSMGFMDVIMVNPKIVSRKGNFETMEGCLSLSGQRKTVRYKEIEVTYLDENFRPQRNTFNGFIAQIIQHEIDHTQGILI